MKKDYYISPNGSDSSDGSKLHPFKTPQRALEAVKNADKSTSDISVYFHGGDYRLNELELDDACGGTESCPVNYKAFGDGEVIINGGTTLKNSLFKPVTDPDVLKRLNAAARDKILVADLTAAGLTIDDIGPLYSIGTASTARDYPDGLVGNNSEFFWNDKRMILSRWPNYKDGHSIFSGVIDHGNKEDRIARTLKLNDEAVNRVKAWKNYNDAWMFAYFMFDWADMSTPISSINTDNGHITPAYYSGYGYKDEGEFYFYNVLEELDSEGEYYIDRENSLIYVYPPEDSISADALITTVKKTLVTGNISNAVFDGITFKGAKADLVSLTGNNITFRNCKIINGYGYALQLDGNNNLVHTCEIAYMGKGGIILKGGDRATLTHGNNIVENCYIHHFEEVFRTYMPGISLNGCGNKALHNEIAHAPHMVISYYGNDHEVAYNYIHDVVYESNDAGAFYAGGDWTACGNVIRYNLFKNIGGVLGKWPKAIYFDDGMSGGEIYGNIVENCYGRPLNFGGGREIKAWNNLTISDIDFPIFYDDRLAKGGWAEGAVFKSVNEGMWISLDRVPYQSELWRERFPKLADIKRDLNEWESPDFPGNPAYSEIRNNIFIGKRSVKEEWRISDNVYKYSTIEDNHIFITADEAILPGTYTVDPDIIKEHNMVWEQIPYTEIGRYGNTVKGR